MRVIAYQYYEDASSSPGSNPWPGSIQRQGQMWPIAQVYTDIALPTTPDYRPQLAQLLADNQSNPAQVVLVADLSQLGESLNEIKACLSTLEAAGSQVVCLAGSEAEASLEGVTALPPGVELGHQVAQQQHRRRLRAGHAQNRLNALPPPGKAPYGYRRGQERYLIDRSAAPVVTAFVNEFLLYGSLRAAVRFVESRFGKRISVSTGRRWLTHPVYRGDLQYHDGQVLRNTHAALISREEAAQIDRLLRRNSQLPPRTAGAPRSLAGLVTCQECGCSLAVSTTTNRQTNHRYLYLRPRACGREQACPAIPYDRALDQIISQICQDLPRAVDQRFASSPEPVNPADVGLQRQIQQKQMALEQLPTLVDNGVLDQATADLRRYTLRGEMAELEQCLAQLPPVNLQELSQSVSIPQFWHDLSEAERRFFFREFIQTINIIRHGTQWEIALTLVF